MKKNIIKSLLSLILSVSMLLTGLGLTVHADNDGPRAVESSQEELSGSGTSLKGSGGFSPLSGGFDPLTGYELSFTIEGVTEEITDSTYEIDDLSKISAISIKYLFENIPNPAEERLVDLNPYELDLPSFYQDNAGSGIIKFSGVEVANYVIDDQKLILTFTAAADTFDSRSLTLELAGSIITESFDEEEYIKVTVPYKDGQFSTLFTVKPSDNYQARDEKKAGKPYRVENGNRIDPAEGENLMNPTHVDWTILVNDARVELNNIIVEDSFATDSGLRLDVDSLEVFKIIRDHNHNYIREEKVTEAWTKVSAGENGFKIEYNTLTSDVYEIRYTTELIGPSEGGSKEITNSASITSDENTNSIKDTFTAEWSIEVPVIEKTGSISDKHGDEINWEVRYNFGFTNENLGKVVLTDELTLGDIIPSTIKVWEITDFEKDANGEYIKDSNGYMNPSEIKELTGIRGSYSAEGITPRLFTFDTLNSTEKSGNLAYLITFDSKVPLGSEKVNVTNKISDQDDNYAENTVKDVITVPSGSKAREQRIDDEGQPFVEWTITLNSKNIEVGTIEIIDLFNPPGDDPYWIFNVDGAHKSIYYLRKVVPEGTDGAIKHEAGTNSYWYLEVASSTGYGISEYVHDESNNIEQSNEKYGWKGFELKINPAGAFEYKFVYQTYYTETGIKKAELANNAILLFKDGFGAGIGEAKQIDASIDGPQAGLNKYGEYVTKEEKTEQIIEWTIIFNQSKIKLEKDSLKITDIFTSNNFTYIENSLEVYIAELQTNGTYKEATQLVVGTDFTFETKADLTYETESGPGFVITFLDDVKDTILVRYRTTADDEGNQDQVNRAILSWQGIEQTVVETLGKRTPGIEKGHAVYVGAKGQKTIKWTVDFNENGHVLYNAKLTDTYTSNISLSLEQFKEKVENIKLEKYKETEIDGTVVYEDVTKIWVLESSHTTYEEVDFVENGKIKEEYINWDGDSNDGYYFTITLGRLEAVPYRLTYDTIYLPKEETQELNNKAHIEFTEGTEHTLEKVQPPPFDVHKKGTLPGTSSEDNNPIISWTIEANYNADNRDPSSAYINLVNPVLTDTIPGDQKLLKETIEVYRVDNPEDILSERTYTELYKWREEDDLDEINLRSTGTTIVDNYDYGPSDYSFRIYLPDGPYQYIVKFDTEILEYPSFDGIIHDKYNNSTDLYNENHEKANDIANVRYFAGEDGPHFTTKYGEQNIDTENIDWTITLNPGALIIKNPRIEDFLDVDKDGNYTTLFQDYVRDEFDNLIISVVVGSGENKLDSSEYTVNWIYQSEGSDVIRGFKLDFADENFVLDQVITLNYATRLKPGLLGSYPLSNLVELFGGTEETSLETVRTTATAQQWVYGGGGSGRNIEFSFLKSSLGNTQLAGAKFTLVYVRFNGDVVPIDDQIVTDAISFNSFGTDSNLRLTAGRYILTETDAPAGYVENGPIYFSVGYDDDPESAHKYFIMLMTEDWSIAGVDAYNSIVSVDGNHMTITNNYESIAVNLEASKLLEDRGLIDSGLSFDFELYQVVDEGEAPIAQVKNDKNGQVVFLGGDGLNEISELQFDLEGKHTFYIHEIPNGDNSFNFDGNIYKVVVNVTESDKGLEATVTYSYYHDSGIEGETPSWVEFTDSELPVFNNYYSARIVLEAKKILSGRRLNKDEFRFKLTEWSAEGSESTEPKEVTNDANGLITFPEITFDKVGNYYYIIEELQGSAGGVEYDKSVIIVKVVVAPGLSANGIDGKLMATIGGYYRTVLNEDGLPESVPGDNNFEPAGDELPTFINRYTAAPDVAIIGARKVLEGKDLTAGMFSFELLDSNNKVIETVKNKADGHINFAEIIYYNAGDYNYTIREVKGTAENGITYDETVHEITVRVTDGGNGQLYTDVIYKENKIATFTNTYKAATTRANLTAHKTLTGKALTANQFSFELVDKDGKVIETVKNKADGSISFAALNFNAAGDYSYTIREIKGSEAGITYDKTVHQVTVKVTDDKEGKLHAEVIYANGKAPTFKNSFSEEGTDSQFPTEPGDESKPGIPQTGEGRSTSALGLALIVAGLAFGLLSWKQRPRKRFSGQE